MLNTNDVLQNRYRILRPLGQGGMGAVYEAIDERFGEPIALKEISFELNEYAPGQLELMTRAFEREAKSLAKARHEAVPYVRDYFSELDRQFLVMELVEGDDLALLLAKRKAPFPLDDVLNWIEQLLDALDYLHNLNPPIIHRDIKPQNLKLNFRRKIKLLDFGIAKSVDSGAFTITNQTFVGATLNYSPIEQILRVMNATFREFILLKHKDRTEKILHQNTDARSDIYALGATFYHLLTNCPPADVVKRTLDTWEGKGDPLEDPTALNREVPASVSRCLVKALEIERDQRYSSAAEMLHDVHSAAVAEGRSLHRMSRMTHETIPVSKETQEPDARQAETEVLLSWEPDEGLAAAADSEPKPSNTQPVIAPEIPVNTMTPEPPDTSMQFVQNSGSGTWERTADSDDPYKTVVIERPPTSAYQPGYEPDPSFNIEVPRRPSRLFLILPISAVAVLVLFGFGTVMWIGSLTKTESVVPAANAAVPAPSAMPATEQNVLSNTQGAPLPTIDTPDIKGAPDIVSNSAKSEPAAVPKRTPASPAVAAPRRSPKPERPQKEISDDCFYNRKCD